MTGSATIIAERIHATVRLAALDARHQSSESMWQTVHRSKDAIALTVLIEDSPALIGVAVTFLGIWLGQVFGNRYFDPAAPVVIDLVLVGAAFTLARESGGLREESLERKQIVRLRKIIASEAAGDSVGRQTILSGRIKRC